MSCHRGIKCTAYVPLRLVKRGGCCERLCGWRWRRGFTLFLPIIGHSEKASQPASSVCAHKLYMGSIKTLNSWFLGNLPATTAAWSPLYAGLLKQQHSWLRLCRNVRSDHHKPARETELFSVQSHLSGGRLGQLPISSHGGEMHYSN